MGEINLKKNIVTPKAPKPVGPYSQAVISGNMIYVAGQGPANPETGEIPPDITGQTKQVLTNIKNILEAAGASLSDVVKSNVFLADLKYFSEFNDVYKQFFSDPYPARTTIGAQLLGILVEIDVIAGKP